MSWAGLAAPLKSNLAGKTKLQTYVSVTFCILFQPSCQCLSSIYLCMKQQFWCFTVFLASLEVLGSIFIKFDFECLCYCLFTLKSYSDEVRSEVTKKQIRSLKCEKKKITIKVNKTVHLPFELKVSVLQRTYMISSIFPSYYKILCINSSASQKYQDFYKHETSLWIVHPVRMQFITCPQPKKQFPYI